jgi:hypothetical protein
LGIITGHEERNLLVGDLILFSNSGGRNEFPLLGRMKSIVRKVLRTKRNAWHHEQEWIGIEKWNIRSIMPKGFICPCHEATHWRGN